MTKVEKEYPVVEIKVDTLKAIEAKIEKLTDEEDNLRNKSKRIEKQEEALYNKRMKLIEEEKEMTKYAKITKYAGLNETDKRAGLEIGKVYEIVSYFEGVTDDCYIYLNKEYPKYFISGTQYELVEKEYPVVEIKVDTLKAIEAKIEKLTDEEDNLRNKRKRIEKQEEVLYNKRMKLIEVVEYLLDTYYI